MNPFVLVNSGSLDVPISTPPVFPKQSSAPRPNHDYPLRRPFSPKSGGYFAVRCEAQIAGRGWCCHRVSCSSRNFDSKIVFLQHSQRFGGVASASNLENQNFNFEVRSPSIPVSTITLSRLSLGDRAFLILAFTGCTICVAFTSFVVAAVPALFTMRRAATSFAKLADTAPQDLPSTMAAIRLSGMELSDLALELRDLSCFDLIHLVLIHEIADGVNKSAQVVQAAEAGVRQMASLARQQTMSIIQERASLPNISLQPVVDGAAKKTTHAVGRATRTFLNIISRGEHNTVDVDGALTDEEFS